MLLLFDLDGTLVSTGGAGRQALEEAIEDVTGVADALVGVRLAGNTDPNILQEVFQTHLQRDYSDEDFDKVMQAYLRRLKLTVADTTSYRIYPGVVQLLAELSATGKHLLGLATGNIEQGAKIKLRRGGLDTHFDYGGYGSDAAERAELVAHAVRRGQGLAQQRGLPIPSNDEVWVLGDTERDVHAAREAGVRVIGITVGSGDPEALAAAKPDVLVETLEADVLRPYFRLDS